MKVLHLSTSFFSQSAGYRLHQGLLDLGIDSKVLVGFRGVDDPTVIGADSISIQKIAAIKRIIDQVPVFLYPKRTGLLFSPSIIPDNIIPKINKINPEIIHLHWICGGYIQVETLKKLKKPLIWTLHDSWAFTGGCHIPYDCKRYRENCGRCPTLGSQRNYDLSRSVFLRKKNAWKDLDLLIVTPSRWLMDCVGQSALFSEVPIKIIPNGIDITRFKPVDKDISRDVLSLPKNKKIVLFGAINSVSDPNKGFSYLKKAFQYLKQQQKTDKIEIVIFGGGKAENVHDFGFKVHSMGMIHDSNILSHLYSAADIFAAPSLSENLPNTIMESLACGTPTVAFRVGGIPELIDHEKNGYLATPFDPEDLAYGIEWILSGENTRDFLSHNARQKIVQEFEISKICQKYYELYQKNW